MDGDDKFILIFIGMILVFTVLMTWIGNYNG